MENIYNNIKKLIESDEKNIHEISVEVIKTCGLNNYFKYVKNDEVLFTKFLKKCDIDNELFFLIVEEINKQKGKYKQTYCNEYKLFLILQLEDNLLYWNSLTRSIFYNPSFKSTNHYKSISQQYSRWCHKGIFKKVFENYSVVKNENSPTAEEINTIRKDDYIIDIEDNLFLDATNVANRSGSEYIVINPENKKKKITKITEICDADGFIISVCANKPKSKKIEYLQKNVGTAPHDSKCINDTLDCCINKNSLTNITLIADKGYKTSECIIINDTNVKLVTPNRKNQKKNLINRHDSKKLGYRHIVENSINGWKHVERVNTRKDKKIVNFMGWVYISCLRHNITVNKIKKVYINNKT